jgi:hypothetical protein
MALEGSIMSQENERRREQETPVFRSAGTHFPFRNGWQVRLLSVESIEPDVFYEISIYDPEYHALTFEDGLANRLKRADSDVVALTLSAVRGFGATVTSVKAAEGIAVLISGR